MNSKAFTIHVTLMLLANITLLYFAIDNFENNTIPTLACIELVIGPIQFIALILLIIRHPHHNSLLYAYLILAIILIGATLIIINSDNIENLQLYLMPILTLSYLMAHFFLYLLYRIKGVQKK